MKDGKELYKLVNNAIYGKTKGKLKKQNQFTTSKQRKRLFKMYIKAKLYVAQNVSQ